MKVLKWGFLALVVVVLSGCGAPPAPEISQEVIVTAKYDMAIEQIANMLTQKHYTVTRVSRSKGIISTLFMDSKMESQMLERPVREKALVLIKKSAGETLSITISVIMESKDTEGLWVPAQKESPLGEIAQNKSATLASRAERMVAVEEETAE